MAPHSSTLAWKIPWTEETGRLQSMGSLRVRHNWATSLSLFIHALDKEMTTHSNVLAWRIPGTGEPGGLLSLGSQSRTWLKWLSISISNDTYGFPSGSAVKNLPAVQEMQQEPWVQSLGQKDPLEKEMATHSSILAWEVSWTETPGWLQSMGSQRLRYDLATKQQWYVCHTNTIQISLIPVPGSGPYGHFSRYIFLKSTVIAWQLLLKHFSYQAWIL